MGKRKRKCAKRNALLGPKVHLKEILDCRQSGEGPLYLCRWRGLSKGQSTWERADRLRGAEAAVDRFNVRRRQLLSTPQTKPNVKHHVGGAALRGSARSVLWKVFKEVAEEPGKWQCMADVGVLFLLCSTKYFGFQRCSPFQEGVWGSAAALCR